MFGLTGEEVQRIVAYPVDHALYTSDGRKLLIRSWRSSVDKTGFVVEVEALVEEQDAEISTNSL